MLQALIEKTPVPLRGGRSARSQDAQMWRRVEVEESQSVKGVLSCWWYKKKTQILLQYFLACSIIRMCKTVVYGSNAKVG